MSEMKKLANLGILFKGISGGNRTYPGFVSMFTGKYMFSVHTANNWLCEITIAEILKENSFDTLFVSACVGDKGFTMWNWQKGFDI